MNFRFVYENIISYSHVIISIKMDVCVLSGQVSYVNEILSDKLFALLWHDGVTNIQSFEFVIFVKLFDGRVGGYFWIYLWKCTYFAILGAAVTNIPMGCLKGDPLKNENNKIKFVVKGNWPENVYNKVER